MIDKYTFGKTPAAIYLADRLNFLDDPKYTRKVSSKIHDVQTILSQAVDAHVAGILDIKTLSFIANSLRNKIDRMAQDLLEVGVDSVYAPEPLFDDVTWKRDLYKTSDELSVSLFTNVLVGELKSINRRVREVKLLKTKQQRLVTKMVGDARLSEVATMKKITIDDIKDQTTPEILIKRSREKLARRGRPNTLYE